VTWTRASAGEENLANLAALMGGGSRDAQGFRSPRNPLLYWTIPVHPRLQRPEPTTPPAARRSGEARRSATRRLPLAATKTRAQASEITSSRTSAPITPQRCETQPASLSDGGVAVQPQPEAIPRRRPAKRPLKMLFWLQEKCGRRWAGGKANDRTARQHPLTPA